MRLLTPAILLPLLLGALPRALPAQEGPVLSVRWRGAPPCPDPARLRQELVQRLAERDLAVKPHAPHALALELAFSARDRVRVSLHAPDGTALFERSVAFRPEECPDLPESLALLVESALRELPWRGHLGPPPDDGGPDAGVEPPDAGLPEPEPLEPLDAGPDLDAGDSGPLEPAPESPPDAGTAPPLDLGPPPPAQVAPVQEAPPASSLCAVVEGGGVASPSPRWLALSGAARLEASHGHWGLALRGNWDSAVEARAGSGEVRAASHSLALWGGYAPWGGLHLAAGPALELLSVETSGYQVDGRLWLLAPALDARAAWRLELVGGLFAEAAATGRLRLRPETLLVEGVGPVLRLPTGWVTLTAGLGWRFF